MIQTSSIKRPPSSFSTSLSSRTLIVLVLFAALLPLRSLRSHLSATYSGGQTYEDVYYLPPQSWLRPLALGYADAAADMMWMRCLLYFGKEMVSHGETKYLFNYIDAMITLDPDFRAAYKWAAMAGLYHSGSVTPEDGYRVVGYLERAIERWPDDGELYWELGSVLRFEIGPMIEDPVEKQRLYEAAMEPLAAAARLGAGPAWLAGLNSQLFNKLGKTEQAIRHLEEMYDSVDDPTEREQMTLQLARLRSERYAAAFQAANDELNQSRKDSYPYLSTNLFLLVGSRMAHERNESLARRFLPAEQTFADEDTTDGLTDQATLP